MTKRNIGRNDPCPCGSGRKFKNCCQEGEEAVPSNAGTTDFSDELGHEMEGRTFASLEEAQAFVKRYTKQRNQAPRDDFHGLSSEQMHRMLFFPFDSPWLVSFQDRLHTSPRAPILILFNLMVEAIDEQGLKTTAKGNLPQKFCRETSLSFWDEKSQKHRMPFCNVNKEKDFIELHVTRLVAGLAGFIRKYKGRFILSRECRRLLAEGGMSSVYPRLFRVYVERFNWGYWDLYPDIHFIQQSFLFSLYLLTRYGDDWRPQIFYEDCFLQAFPMVIDEVESGTIFTPEQVIRSCFSWRVFERFAGFLGLALVEPVATDKTYVREFRIKKLPLLDEMVQFHLDMQH